MGTRSKLALVALVAALALVLARPLEAQRLRGIGRITGTAQPVAPPGGGGGGELQGVLELSTDTTTRALPDATWIANNVAGGEHCFRFPSPWLTYACKVSDAVTWCPAGDPTDCVNFDHYSDWAQINAHQGLGHFDVFLSYQNGVSTRVGPAIYRVDKAKIISDPLNAVTYRGRVATTGGYATSRTSGWFWSHTDPNVLYGYGEDSSIWAFNCATVSPCTPTEVIDLVDYAAEWGGDTTNLEAKSVKSSNDHLHWVLTVLDTVTAEKGCLYVRLGAGAKSEFVPWDGVDPGPTETGGDCALSRDGEYVTTAYLGTGDSNDVGIWRTDDWAFILDWSDECGAPGHSDSGLSHIVAMDQYAVADAVKLWDYTQTFFTSQSPCTPAGSQGLIVHRAPVDGNSYAQPSTINMVPAATTPIADQVFFFTATDSPAPNPAQPREREIIAASLDGTLRVVTCAPTLADLTAAGDGEPGSDLEYGKAPKGNVDPYGEYYLWHSNAGGSRLEVFVVYIDPCADRLRALVAAPAPTPSVWATLWTGLWRTLRWAS